MVQQFEENRKEAAAFISALPTSKLAKNQIGDHITALLVSAYAVGFAHGNSDKEMTTESWSLIVNETRNGTGNDFIREMLNSIQFDFHALGGVK
jgi:ribulose bisphosphate carboxylase small subunit